MNFICKGPSVNFVSSPYVLKGRKCHLGFFLPKYGMQWIALVPMFTCVRRCVFFIASASETD